LINYYIEKSLNEFGNSLGFLMQNHSLAFYYFHGKKFVALVQQMDMYLVRYMMLLAVCLWVFAAKFCTPS
jgi:hypothetical protein